MNAIEPIEAGACKGGWKWAAQVISLADSMRARTLLDYGGDGSLATMLPDRFAVSTCGLTAGANAVPADIAVCIDALDAVPPARLDGVLDALEGLATRALFLVVPLSSLAPADWWLTKLSRRWPRHDADDRCQPWAERHASAPRLRFVWRRDPQPRLPWLGRARRPDIPSPPGRHAMRQDDFLDGTSAVCGRAR